jgi:hypothetical protein
MITTTEPTPCELAIEIISATHDGDDLSPQDLYLVECAVNGLLKPSGLELFADLHKRVKDGTYRPQWLQGVEHLTRDHAGYVYWKGQEIEHWDSRIAYDPEYKAAAEDLARRCRILEAEAKPIDKGTVIWNWPEEATA